MEHYDRHVSPKLYLTFSEKRWRRLFENEVRCIINRVQRGEWLALFREKGFELVEEEARRIDISGLKLADRYANIERAVIWSATGSEAGPQDLLRTASCPCAAYCPADAITSFFFSLLMFEQWLPVSLSSAQQKSLLPLAYSHMH